MLHTKKLIHLGVFLGIAVVSWLALPDRLMGPYNALNPHVITQFIVVLICIAALGKISVLLFGNKVGLIVTGFLSGFASSTAAIYSMGTIYKQQNGTQKNAVLGAIISNVATLIQTLKVCSHLLPLCHSPHC
ncbi:MAG: DUF4010 domain-containing protein [Cytophagales bacterium]|nr:DUF4010 domain-containing protein [Cytophagales bacterium]